MNKYILILPIVAFTFYSPCHAQNNITSPSTVDGKFVVDSIETTAIVKTDTITKSLKTYITSLLVYHFENYPGTLDKISITANLYGRTTFWSNIGPENINDPHRFKDIYKILDSFIGQDSIKINRELSGKFWTNDSTNIANFLNRFSWKDSLYVRIER
jgi:hypothetical protein